MYEKVKSEYLKRISAGKSETVQEYLKQKYRSLIVTTIVHFDKRSSKFRLLRFDCQVGRTKIQEWTSEQFSSGDVFFYSTGQQLISESSETPVESKTQVKSKPTNKSSETYKFDTSANSRLTKKSQEIFNMTSWKSLTTQNAIYLIADVMDMASKLNPLLGAQIDICELSSSGARFLFEDVNAAQLRAKLQDTP